ncbi:MAG: multiheme c-type cytochrome [Candidatus Krumholzibacteria bacterium]|nr:multiheme c-type cytochrome [Candidatus Krumholzibacteria bacterium]
MKRILLSVAALLVLAPGGDSEATERYADQTGKGCSFCHELGSGGPLNEVGLAYVRNDYRYPIPERILDKAAVLRSPLHRTLRSILGYIHLVAACILAGSIVYVHVFIRPAQLRGGVPRGERTLGLGCMSTLTATGIYLAWYRLDSPSSFLASRFGVLLLVKLALFAVMITLAILAVTVVSRTMRRRAALPGGAPADATGVTRENLGSFDGTGGRPAYVLYDGAVYDVSGSVKWPGGAHFRKHLAGRDLTGDLAGAPHGPEVFSGLPVVARLDESPGVGAAAGPGGARRIFVAMAWTNLVIVLLILACVSSWRWGVPVPQDRAEGAQMREAACADCHAGEDPGIYHDWKRSIHAKVGVGCIDCHETFGDSGSVMASGDHLEHSPVPVTALVTPGRCGACHGEQTGQYARSKHAHTLEITEKIDSWIIHGLNNEVERATGCYACHGSVVRLTVDGRPEPGTWPNVGVGRVNPDGTLGSCTSCHTRHRFSAVEARRPEACGQCHLGPDHPQVEIYDESKHGAIYHAEGDSWSWRADDMRWLAGRDYRTPTCASCHMSEAAGAAKTHDVTERLSWELQAPLTVRPEEFAPFPAALSWREERSKMAAVCLQCHSSGWTLNHFGNLDRVIENYNENYYRPAREVFDRLYASGALSADMYFDEPLEWEFYEFWHHEGRRARMGAAMMAPDYAWWHGFYELKHRYATFMEEAERALRSGRDVRFDEIPGTLQR